MDNGSTRKSAAIATDASCGNGRAAIVTGASSGIGRAVSERLGGMGYEVFGFGREFADEPLWEKDRMHPVVCDLLDTQKLCGCVKSIQAQYAVHVLVNNAGVGYYGLHEELNPQKIQQMVRTNLEVPMILAQQLLRDLKKHTGYLIQIASVTSHKTNPHGCAYGATKAGLASFSASLFEEARKYGVKAVTISPDMTKSGLYRNADFCEGDDADSYLLPEETAAAVEYVLCQREGMAITDLTLRPQRHQIKRQIKKKT